MQTYIFLFVFFWWLLLLLTFAPAIATGLICAWRMAGVSQNKALLAGFAGGFVGVACSIGWYWFEHLFLPRTEALFIGHFMLPVPSSLAAWVVCRVWRRPDPKA